MEENVKWGNDGGKYVREEESRWSCNEWSRARLSDAT